MNLLPTTEKESLKKGLKLRFVIVMAFLLAASFLVGFIMLLPSYFLARAHLTLAESGNYNAAAGNENLDKEILNLPGEINFKLKFLQSNIASLPSVDVLYKIINPMPEGVTLDSVSFSRNQKYKGEDGINVLISGKALNRDSLLSFSTTLKDSNYFSSVDVPVSSFTKNKDIPFSMDIFIKN